MTLFLGKREVKLMQLGAGHTAGDIVAWVPDADVMFSGDLVEYHSACYCGDAHLRDWPVTLERDPRLRPQGRSRPAAATRSRAGRRCARRSP